MDPPNPNPNPPNTAGPPPSPWAAKFGLPPGAWPSLTRQGHSSMAPHVPYLDPTWYATNPPASMPPIPPPPRPDLLDDLFAAERTQQRYLGGLKAWQAGALATPLARWVPGGHDRDAGPPVVDAPAVMRIAAARVEGGGVVDAAAVVLDGDLLRVDEGRWCKVFRRERWFDLAAGIAEGVPEPVDGVAGDGVVWSVDCPAVWEVMRVCLELADRLVKATAETGFLDTLLFGFTMQVPSGEWTINGRAQEAQASAAEILQELDRFAPRLVFSFIDEENSRTDLSNHHPVGETRRVHDEDSKWFVYSGIHVRFLRVLLSKESTLAEKTLARFGFAVTVVHQLMHAIFYCQEKERIINLLGEFPKSEWFMETEWVRELGCSWENSIFGGQVTLHPSYVDKKSGRGNFMFASIQDWPNPAMGDMSKGREAGAELGRRYVFPVPTYWISCLLAQEYWDLWVPMYGAQALQFPRMFRSRRSDIRDHSAHRLRVNFGVREMRPGLRDAAKDFLVRRAHWRRLRPWYRVEHLYWAVSPWSDVHFRAALERFWYAYHARDEVGGHRAYREVRDASLAQGSFNRNWFWQGVSMIMSLTLPMRQTEAHANLATAPRPGAWRRSGAAATAGVPWEFDNPACNVEGARSYVLETRHFAGGRGTRKHIHTLGKKFLEEAERLYPLNIELTLGVWHSWASIGRQMRTRNLGEGDWLEFDFAMPLYEGKEMHLPVPAGVNGPEKEYVEWTGDPKLEMDKYDLSSVDSISAKGEAVDEYDSDPGEPGVMPAANIAKFQVLDSARPERYYTVGEVNDHRAQDDLWLLCDDGQFGFDIYEATGIWDAMVEEDPRYREAILCEKTQYGWKVIHPDLEWRVKETARFLGKLMKQSITEEEAREMDGLNSRPLWVVIGRRIFDVTRFPCRRGLERAYLYFLQNPSKVSSPNAYREWFLENLGDRAPEMLREMELYCCGTIRSSLRRSARVRPFTANEVGWHNNKDHRMYIIILDGVYDVTDFEDFHPGGRKLLQGSAGKDVTQQFRDSHQDWQGCLKTYEHLKIGRIVEERERTSINLGEFEIMLEDKVYNIQSLTVTNGAAYQALLRWFGTDSTAVLRQQQPRYLVWLAEQPDLIVAKIARPLKPLTRDMLAYHNDCSQAEDAGPDLAFVDLRLSLAEFLARNNKSDVQSGREPWVGVDNDIYCVSDLIIKGSSCDMPTGVPVWEALRSYAGKNITDQVLAQWIRDYHQCRKIGYLVAPGSLAKKFIYSEGHGAYLAPHESRYQRKRKGADLFDDGDEGDDGHLASRRRDYAWF